MVTYIVVQVKRIGNDPRVCIFVAELSVAKASGA